MTDPYVINKLKGTLIPSLLKVQKQVQPMLTVHHDALVYLGDLIIQLLYQLCCGQPHSIPDLEEKIQKSFPTQIINWAIDSAQQTIEKGKKKTMTLSVDKLQPIIHKEVLGYKIDQLFAMYLVAVLEYISADILKLAGNYVKNIRHSEITAQDIKVAMGADKVLMSMFQNEDIEFMEPIMQPSALSKRGSLMYIEVLKDFRIAEEQYLRELNLIIKAFQEPMLESKDLFSDEDLENIFSNIKDIYELTIQFCGMIETAFEMANDNTGSDPLVGHYIVDLAVECEFDYYDTYAREQVGDIEDESDEQKDRVGTYGKIRELLKKPGVKDYFEQKGLFHAVKYILPKLLYEPIYHCQEYLEYIRLIMMTSPDGEDRDNLDQSLDVLRPLQLKIERVLLQPALRRSPEAKVFYQCRMGTAVPNATAKILSIQANIEGWEGKDLCQIASLFLKEGTLMKISPDGRKASERRVFLFDNLILCTKPNTRITGFCQAEYRLKERINLRKAEVVDCEDDATHQNCFEVSERNVATLLLCCKDDDEKYEWLSYLMTLQYRSHLDRMLDVILQEEEQRIELRYPDPAVYIFAEDDSMENIVFEDPSEDDSDVPIIKGGTLYKLVERLTYHKYADPNFVRVFLTTYRSFSNPVELLNLLISRYRIPDPVLKQQEGSAAYKALMRRFRKEYVQPIQLRVLNVLRHWVDQHFYDFQREHGELLLSTLEKFLSGINRNKTAKKWVDTIEKIVRRRLEAASTTEHFTFNKPAPPIEWHIGTTLTKFTILTLHPLEIGRQLTLLHSEIFRAIKPSELVGTAQRKKDKAKLSPNKTRMINLSTRLTYWYMMSICETHNFEERVAIYSRIIDILNVFYELNNFNGMYEILGALDSASVHRLHLTTAAVRGLKIVEECRELCDEHNIKYTEKLRSINPPCVPYLGIYLTNILKTEEGNPDFLGNNSDGLINFSKRRMVAGITGEIQKYQDAPYNLAMEPIIRQFIEELDPLAGRTDEEFRNYLYDLSLKIEPRNSKQPPKFPRLTDISLRSPGIKPSSRSSGIRWSTSQISESGSPPTRRRPPSPSPSTCSYVFTIRGDEEEENEDQVDSDRDSPPPCPPRVPTIGEATPEIPEKPYMYKQTSTWGESMEVFEDDSPPVLPPRTPVTPLSSISDLKFVLPDVPPVPMRSMSGEPRERLMSDNTPPPVLPPRNTKPTISQPRIPESINLPTEALVPPELPPRKTLPR